MRKPNQDSNNLSSIPSLQEIGLAIALGLVTIVWIYTKLVKKENREEQKEGESMEEEKKGDNNNNDEMEETKEPLAAAHQDQH